MSSSLRLDWCDYAAARYACKHWHYSGSLPTPPCVKVGVWERGSFRGCVIFSRGGARSLLAPYGLDQTEGAELTRIALREHETPVSRIVRIAGGMLKKQSPGLRLLVSFADPAHGHAGGIYMAGGWIYTGTTSTDTAYRDSAGRLYHSRTVSERGYKLMYGKRRAVFKPSQLEAVALPGKHRYLMPLDAEMREHVLPLARPYPRRQSIGSDATAFQAAEGAVMRPDGSVGELAS